MERRTIDISTGIVFRSILILIGVWFLYYIRDILALVFISIVIVAAMDPIVTWLQKRKVRRAVSVLLIYLVIFLIGGLVVSFLLPPLVSQLIDFAHKLPNYSMQLENTFLGINTFFQAQHIALNTQGILQNVSQWLSDVTGSIFTTTIGIFSGFVAVIIILVMAFYMAVHEDGIKKFIVSLTPEKHKSYAASLTDRIKNKIGRWTLGQLTIMFIIFLFELGGLLALHVPYALTIALFGGLMEIVPYIGPIVGAVPAILAGLLVSPLTGLLVLILYIVIQQFEGHIIAPQIIGKAVGLHPIAIILALLVGFKLGGILGAVIAIPATTVISVFVVDLFEKPKEM
jgi:predicted PurR-regulated permease PerM